MNAHDDVLRALGVIPTDETRAILIAHCELCSNSGIAYVAQWHALAVGNNRVALANTRQLARDAIVENECMYGENDEMSDGLRIYRDNLIVN
jgi:hypothetical protein